MARRNGTSPAPANTVVLAAGAPKPGAAARAMDGAGDPLIVNSALLLALLVVAVRTWPRVSHIRLAALTVTFGVIYTVFSVRLTTNARERWTTSDLMPSVPPMGAGVSPTARWIIVPLAVFWWARRPTLSHPQPVESRS